LIATSSIGYGLYSAQFHIIHGREATEDKKRTQRPNAREKVNVLVSQSSQSIKVRVMVNDKKPDEHHFEWMGPYGTIILIVFLPINVLALYYLCNENGCFHLPFSYAFSIRSYVVFSTPVFFYCVNLSQFISFISLSVFRHGQLSRS
jgi:hypothetical protein